MAVIPLAIEEIVSNPDVRAGVPVIAGTGIRVVDLIAYHIYGDKLTAAQLAEDFRLSLGQVYAALSYYHLHQQELDTWMEADAKRAERLIQELEAQGKARRIDHE